MPGSADYSLIYGTDHAAESLRPRASERGGRLNLYLWTLLAVTNFADVLGTRRAFEIGIGELNPLVDVLHAAYGVAGIVAPKAFFLMLLFVLLPYVCSWTRALLALTCSIYLGLTLAHIWYLSPLL